MHWILIGIGLIILRITEPMFGMFLSEISWFVFSGLFIYLGLALHNLQITIRELQIRQRELLLELKRVSNSKMRALQTPDFIAQDALDTAQTDNWLETESGFDEFYTEISGKSGFDERENWVPNEAKSESPEN